QDQAEQGRECAELGRDEEPGRDEVEAVGDDVHHHHGDGDHRHAGHCLRVSAHTRHNSQEIDFVNEGPLMCPLRPSAQPGRAGRLLWLRWIVALPALGLGTTLAPGYVLCYDMVWVPALAVTRPDVWGLGSGLPRAVPSDAVVALLGVVVPQQLLQKAILL